MKWGELEGSTWGEVTNVGTWGELNKLDWETFKDNPEEILKQYDNEEIEVTEELDEELTLLTETIIRQEGNGINIAVILDKKETNSSIRIEQNGFINVALMTPRDKLGIIAFLGKTKETMEAMLKILGR